MLLAVALVLSLNCLLNAENASNPLPVIFWHGINDVCCNGDMKHKAALLQAEIPNTYIKSVKIGNSETEQKLRSIFANANHQVDQVCRELQEDEKFSQGYHAIGFSQGCLLLRALAERCPHPPMRKLMTLGGPHQGVNGFPNCPVSKESCELFRRLLDVGAYWPWVQNKLVPAQYWHDPFQEPVYQKKSILLADINNGHKINLDYKKNLMNLEKLVLVMFDRDTTLIPKETSWFGFYIPGQDKKVVKMEETELYKQDKIGLRHLNQSGRLFLDTINADHMHVSDYDWIRLIRKYLK